MELVKFYQSFFTCCNWIVEKITDMFSYFFNNTPVLFLIISILVLLSTIPIIINLILHISEIFSPDGSTSISGFIKSERNKKRNKQLSEKEITQGKNFADKYFELNPDKLSINYKGNKFYNQRLIDNIMNGTTNNALVKSNEEFADNYFNDYPERLTVTMNGEKFYNQKLINDIMSGEHYIKLQKYKKGSSHNYSSYPKGNHNLDIYVDDDE